MHYVADGYHIFNAQSGSD